MPKLRETAAALWYMLILQVCACIHQSVKFNEEVLLLGLKVPILSSRAGLAVLW